MRKKMLYIMIAVFAMALVATVAMAGPGYGRGMGYGYGVPPVSNLTPDQATQIQSIQQAHLKDVTPLQQQLLAKKMELRAAWLAQNPDQAKINAVQKEVFDLIDKLQQESTKMRAEILKVLAPTEAK